MAVATVHLGDLVIMDGGERWTVASLQANHLTLRSGNAIQGMWLHELQTRNDVIILPGDQRDDRPEMPDVDAFHDFDLTDPNELDRARRKLGHINQLLYGCTGGKDGSGEKWEPWDPHRRVTALDRVKLKELEREPDLGIGSLKTLRKYRMKIQNGGGLTDLIDPRYKRKSASNGRCPPEVVDALTKLYQQNATGSYRNFVDFFDALPEVLAADPDTRDRWAAGEIKIPAPQSLYRVMKRITGGRNRTGSQKAQRADANRPEPIRYSMLHALRPGHKVLLDTTSLDIMGLENGKDVALELTIAVDWYSRTILAWSIHKKGAKDVDIGTLIGKILTPEPMRPNWQDNRRIAYQIIPLERDLSLDDWFEKAVQHPVVWPDTLLIDRGRSYLNMSMLERAAQLGINIQPSRPYTPTDKAIVEATFRAISQMFCHHVRGYKGSNVLMRGKDVKGFWSMTQLEEFFSEWVLTVWQVHQHEGLRSEWDHAFLMTPNEKYAEGVAAAGYLPVYATGDLYTLMLPCKWVTITDKGIKVGNLIYRNAWTRAHRAAKSAVGHRGGKWAVRWDPRNRQSVRVIDHRNDEIIEVPWIGRNIYSLPFGDTRLREARRIAKARNHGALPTDHQVAEALRDIKKRANPKPTKKERERDERLDLTDNLEVGASIADQERLRDLNAVPGVPVIVEEPDAPDVDEPDTDDAVESEVEDAPVVSLTAFPRTSLRRRPANTKKEDTA